MGQGSPAQSQAEATAAPARGAQGRATGPFGLVDLESEDIRETLTKIAEDTYTIFACFLPGPDRKSMKGVAPPEAARAKARELTVYDEWAARGGAPKPKRSRRTTAEIKADKALERVSRMPEATAAAIAVLPALTAAGIRAKLKVVTASPDYKDGRDQFGTQNPPLIAIGASLLRDLRRIDPAARLTPPMAV